jgi:hypothetical protein
MRDESAMQDVYQMRSTRIFGQISTILPDGSAIIRRCDGKGEVPLDAYGAKRLEVFRVGAYLEFVVQFNRDLGIDQARDACSLAEGNRRAGAFMPRRDSADAAVR